MCHDDRMTHGIRIWRHYPRTGTAIRGYGRGYGSTVRSRPAPQSGMRGVDNADPAPPRLCVHGVSVISSGGMRRSGYGRREGGVLCSWIETGTGGHSMGGWGRFVRGRPEGIRSATACEKDRVGDQASPMRDLEVALAAEGPARRVEGDDSEVVPPTGFDRERRRNDLPIAASFVQGPLCDVADGGPGPPFDPPVGGEPVVEDHAVDLKVAGRDTKFLERRPRRPRCRRDRGRADAEGRESHQDRDQSA